MVSGGLWPCYHRGRGRDTALEVAPPLGAARCATAKVIYGGQDDIISQYVTFCHVLDEQYRKFGRTASAVRETIRICKDRNVLKNYLEEREKEVISIMLTLFDQETAEKNY
ncbi:MAG: hypothetical protein IJR68_12515, partial [Fretibacterium sp.]|nr:hypothetical protein [Fretibacterium sp.]